MDNRGRTAFRLSPQGREAFPRWLRTPPSRDERPSLPRASAAVAGGVTLSVLGGVVPLMAPNALMPDAVRLAHLVEVGTSNLLFGWLTVLALTRASARNAPHTEVAPPLR